MFGAREELFHSPHRIRLKRTSSVLLNIKTEISSKILKILSNTFTFSLLPSLSLHSQTQSKRKIIYAQLGNGKKNLEDFYGLKKHLDIENLFFDKMLGNFFLKLVFFLTRGSYSLTLLSCNSDAQANDNVNSDVKVSTPDPKVFHGS